MGTDETQRDYWRTMRPIVRDNGDMRLRETRDMRQSGRMRLRENGDQWELI